MYKINIFYDEEAKDFYNLIEELIIYYNEEIYSEGDLYKTR